MVVLYPPLLTAWEYSLIDWAQVESVALHKEDTLGLRKYTMAACWDTILTDLQADVHPHAAPHLTLGDCCPYWFPHYSLTANHFACSPLSLPLSLLVSTSHDRSFVILYCVSYMGEDQFLICISYMLCICFDLYMSHSCLELTIL